MEKFDFSKIEDSESVDSSYTGKNKYDLSEKAKLLVRKWEKFFHPTGGEIKMTEAEREKNMTLTSTPEEIENAKQEISDLISLGAVHLASVAKEILPVTEAEFQQAVKQGIFKLLRDRGWSHSAFDAIREFKIPIFSQEIIDAVPYVKAVLGEIQKISLDFYNQLLNSPDSLINLCNGTYGPLVKTDDGRIEAMVFDTEKNRSIILNAFKQVATSTKSMGKHLGDLEEKVSVEIPKTDDQKEKEKPLVLFHGTVVSGIKELEPRKRLMPEGSNKEHHPKLVYAGDEPAFAAAQSFPWTSNEGFELGFDDNKVIFRVPEDQKERLNRRVFIYLLSSDSFKKTGGEGTGHTYHSTEKVKIDEVKEFESVEQAVKHYGGEIIYYKR